MCLQYEAISKTVLSNYGEGLRSCSGRLVICRGSPYSMHRESLSSKILIYIVQGPYIWTLSAAFHHIKVGIVTGYIEFFKGYKSLIWCTCTCKSYTDLSADCPAPCIIHEYDGVQEAEFSNCFHCYFYHADSELYILVSVHQQWWNTIWRSKAADIEEES